MASTVRPTGARAARSGPLPGALLGALLALPALGCADDPVEVIEEPPCRTALVGYPESEQTGSLRHVHDPEVVQGADAYYVFSTNDGVPIRRSTDLLRWELLGRVFPGGYPSWAPSEVPGVEGVWAPGMGHFGGEYHLYYSLSTFGSPRSVIGLATSPTLDPQDPAYGWQDRGKVVESHDWDPANAIDPAVVEDPDGGVWLAWGSWGGGIVMRELDPTTGLVSAENDTLYALARRPVERAIEGPYIVRRGGYYYLFVGFDLCCRGVESTYSVRVGRAERVTGPYVDRDGVPMMEGGGTLVLESYGPVRGPGHASVLERAGEHLLVHHYYDANDNGVPHLQIRPLLWDDQGWPVADLPYDGSTVGAPPASPDLAGAWGLGTGDRTARRIDLAPDGTAVACDREGSWSYAAPVLTLEWDTDGIGGPAGVYRTVISADAGTLAGWSPDGAVVHGYRLQQSTGSMSSSTDGGP